MKLTLCFIILYSNFFSNTTADLGPEKRLVFMFLLVALRIHPFVKNTALMLKMDGNQTAAREPGSPEGEATLSLGRSVDQGVLTEQLKSKPELRVTPGACANIPPAGGSSLLPR